MGNVGHNFTDLSEEGKKKKKEENKKRKKDVYQAVIRPCAIISHLLKGAPSE